MGNLCGRDDSTPDDKYTDLNSKQHKQAAQKQPASLATPQKPKSAAAELGINVKQSAAAAPSANGTTTTTNADAKTQINPAANNTQSSHQHIAAQTSQQKNTSAPQEVNTNTKQSLPTSSHQQYNTDKTSEEQKEQQQQQNGDADIKPLDQLSNTPVAPASLAATPPAKPITDDAAVRRYDEEQTAAAEQQKADTVAHQTVEHVTSQAVAFSGATSQAVDNSNDERRLSADDQLKADSQEEYARLMASKKPDSEDNTLVGPAGYETNPASHVTAAALDDKVPESVREGAASDNKRVCSKCAIAKPKSDFTASQLKNKSKAKCKTCTGN